LSASGSSHVTWLDSISIAALVEVIEKLDCSANDSHGPFAPCLMPSPQGATGISSNPSYIGVMNRRRFTQSLLAVLSLPAAGPLSFGSARAMLPAAAAVAVPKQARFWAIYLSGLHGECSPKTLQTLLHIPEGDARRYLGQLIADGVVKPNPLLQSSVRNVFKSNEEGLFDKVKKRFDMKARTDASNVETDYTVDDPEGISIEADLSESSPEASSEALPEIDLEGSDEPKQKDAEAHATERDLVEGEPDIS